MFVSTRSYTKIPKQRSVDEEIGNVLFSTFIRRCYATRKKLRPGCRMKQVENRKPGDSGMKGFDDLSCNNIRVHDGFIYT